MKKEEVYDYLAHIYFDKKGAKKKSRLNSKPLLAFFGITALICAFIGGSLLFHKPRGKTNQAQDLFLSPGDDFAKINYDFPRSSLKVAGYTLNLNNLNASSYQILSFRLRRERKEGTTKLRVEVENSYKEKSSVYLEAIPGRWADFTLRLKDFKGISSWKALRRVSFVVEEWNAGSKNDCVYIDNIRFIKNP